MVLHEVLVNSKYINLMKYASGPMLWAETALTSCTEGGFCIGKDGSVGTMRCGKYLENTQQQQKQKGQKVKKIK